MCSEKGFRGGVAGGWSTICRRTKRCLDVGAHEPVTSVARCVLLAEAGDPAFCQADADVDLAGAEGGDHVARSGRKGDQVGVEAEVLVCEVDGRGKVLWHIAYSEWGRGCGSGCGCCHGSLCSGCWKFWKFGSGFGTLEGKQR